MASVSALLRKPSTLTMRSELDESRVTSSLGTADYQYILSLDEGINEETREEFYYDHVGVMFFY